MSETKNMSKRKQSMLLGGLISSAGIFISKFLGLIYVIPFNYILQTNENQSYYYTTYNIYSYILTIATAGLPFAIATLIAKYSSRGDYKTCLLVKKISFITMAAFGFVCMLCMMLGSGMIAKVTCPEDLDVNIMKNVIIIISLAVFIIPVLSSLRGFYQGLKELQIYSMSQVLEQLVRIIFLLTFGALIVYVFNQDAVWALYFSVFAASVSGFLTIFYIRWKGNHRLIEVKELARTQELKPAKDANVVFKELLFVAIPFLLISIFGYCDAIVNQMDLKPGLAAFGEMAYTAEVNTSVFGRATKIIAIPMVLAPGFSAAIIPYITSALEHKNMKLVRKNITECIESVLYIAIPVCFALFVFAKPIMFVLFPHVDNAQLALDTFTMKWYALEALCATVCPVFSSIVMAIGYRKKIVINTMLFALIKIATNRLFITWWGIPGMVLSSAFAYAVFTILNVYVIQKYFHVNWKYTFRKLIFIVLGVLGFYLLSLLFTSLGWIDHHSSKMVSLLYLMLMGLACCGVYFAITAFCNIPQTIFHFDLGKIFSKIKAKVKRA
ncbi:oligosaccharide flippase family protein [Amedibacillus sp. YH-ame10]